jgi:hypothetical protein
VPPALRASRGAAGPRRPGRLCRAAWRAPAPDVVWGAWRAAAGAAAPAAAPACRR